MKNVKKVFVILYMMFSLIYLFLIFKGQKDVIHTENRSANKFPVVSIKSFYNNVFQAQLENSLIDQFPFGEGIKSRLINYENIIFNALTVPNKNKSYYKVTKDYYSYNYSDYLLYGVFDYNIVESEKEEFEKVAKPFNDVEGIDKYIYFINTEQTINFDNVSMKISQDVLNLYPTCKGDFLKISNFEEYKNYFYKTDHHWNHRGSYQGYKDIIRLMLGDDEEILVPNDEIEFQTVFYGSKANKAKFFKYEENFKAYTYSIKPYTVYVDGKECSYGGKDNYVPDKYYEPNTIGYASYYGWDAGEVVYDFKQPQKENLLIISGSFSNAINDLIASHFNKTYIIDIRHNKEFDVKEYINKNKIDKLIFITYISHSKGTEFLMNGGGEINGVF